MYRIALVNMPLSELRMPSLALTQLQATLRRELGERVDARVHYLNHDFAHWLGLEEHRELMKFEHHPTGLGEWFFSAAAFPGAPDNADAYFKRHYPQHDERNRIIKAIVLQKRARLVAHLDDCITRFALDQADLVGFTSMFSQNVANLAMARRIRERNPQAVIVMGGANCEGPMGREAVQSFSALDFVFSGPALRSFPRLVRALLDGDEAACHRIDGVYSRRNLTQAEGCATGGIVALGGPPQVRAFGEADEIDHVVELDYAPFLDAYEAQFPGAEPAFLSFETSRGCWWGERAHCTFCGLNGSTIAYHAMSPPLAVRMLSGLFRYEGRCNELQSVDNILPRSYLSDVLPYLDTPPTMSLFYEVKADLTEDDFRVLARARVIRIQPGIEALNTSTLKLMRKGTSSFQNLLFLMNSLRYGIHPAWNLLIGFPGEEIEVYEKYLDDIPLLVHLPPPGGVFPIRFDRFSPYYDEAVAYGLDLQPLDWYGFTYPLPPESLAGLAYYFADHHYTARYAMNTAKMVGRLREKVGRWIDDWRRPETRARLELESLPGGGAGVTDSRSGELRRYTLTEDARRVLDALSAPKKLAALEKDLPGVEVDAALDELRLHGLIFQENERMLGLVVPPVSSFTIPTENLRLAGAGV